MTANGDGLNFDFLQEPASAKKPEPPADSPPATSPVEVSASAPSDGVLDDIDLDVVDDGSSSSIFDDGPEAPAKSADEIPDAVPNISDGGTEILVRGRTEIRDFTEDFGAGPAPEAPSVGARDEEILDLSSGLPESKSVADEFAPSAALQNPLGGTFFSDRDTAVTAAPSPVESHADTDVSGFTLPSPPASEPETYSPETPVEAASESDDLPVTAEPPHVSLDGLNDSGLSLSSVTSASATTATASAVAKAASVPAPKGSKLLLIVIGGYALAVTGLCVMLLLMLAKAKAAGQLESLPDLKPIPPGKVAIYKIDTDLPVGHTLKLGDHQRFGHLRVEPLKVTRSPIRFQHFSKDAGNDDYDSAPVLKLWVKFTNESKDQAFVPLDSDLLFRRHHDAQDTVKANNFLVHRRDKFRKSPPQVFVYDHPLSSDWDMAGQQLGTELQPGESLETYIPTTEDGIDRLKGELLWRLQLRKGHSPRGNGVTTLVEVAFTADQIQSEGS